MSLWSRMGYDKLNWGYFPWRVFVPGILLSWAGVVISLLSDFWPDSAFVGCYLGGAIGSGAGFLWHISSSRRLKETSRLLLVCLGLYPIGMAALTAQVWLEVSGSARTVVDLRELNPDFVTRVRVWDEAEPSLSVTVTDRVAIDAGGLAILKHHGSNDAIMSKKIFDQGQIARAVELKIGGSSPDKIELVTGDAESADYAGMVKEILMQG